MLGLQGAPALVRIARREVRRHPRRSALIVALIALPVAVVACGLAAQATAVPSDAELHRQELGRADLVVGDPDPSPARQRQGTDVPGPANPAAVEQALREVMPGGSEVVASRRTRLDVSSGDRAVSAVVIATDAPRPVNDGRFRVDQGRLPARSGETALAPGAARDLGVAMGDVVTLHPHGARLEVVGFARATGALFDWTVVVPDRHHPVDGVAGGSSPWGRWGADRRRAA